MCGIVGILGREPVAPSLIDALKRLEYRGYDSAGVATLESGQLARRRAEGELRNLEARLAREPLAGTIGIGHTRWATHGRPTESNAHPHATDRLAVVYNGIIENFRECASPGEAPVALFMALCGFVAQGLTITFSRAGITSSRCLRPPQRGQVLSSTSI
jgi:glucosamine--fructose-6-phosphate aminotransferase (isomerizing)